MKAYIFPRSNESSDNIKFFRTLLTKEECVSFRPKIWKIIPRRVEKVSRDKYVFHKHYYCFQQKPKIDPDRSQESVGVQSLKRVQD